jgi:hypothetical protein
MIFTCVSVSWRVRRLTVPAERHDVTQPHMLHGTAVSRCAGRFTAPHAEQLASTRSIDHTGSRGCGLSIQNSAAIHSSIEHMIAPR